MCIRMLFFVDGLLVVYTNTKWQRRVVVRVPSTPPPQYCECTLPICSTRIMSNVWLNNPQSTFWSPMMLPMVVSYCYCYCYPNKSTGRSSAVFMTATRYNNPPPTLPTLQVIYYTYHSLMGYNWVYIVGVVYHSSNNTITIISNPPMAPMLNYYDIT